jgi:hypothetical protein
MRLCCKRLCFTLDTFVLCICVWQLVVSTSIFPRLNDTALSVAADFVLFATTANESNKLGFNAASGKTVAGGGEKKGGGRKMTNSERGQFALHQSYLNIPLLCTLMGAVKLVATA